MTNDELQSLLVAALCNMMNALHESLKPLGYKVDLAPLAQPQQDHDATQT